MVTTEELIKEVFLCYLWYLFFSTIRYHGFLSIIKCHACHLVGGEDSHPWSATKGGNPIPVTILVDLVEQKNKDIILATVSLDW